MARVVLTDRALRDLERLFDFVAGRDPGLAAARLASMRAAFAVLQDHPRLGRPAEDGRRELGLARGRDACAAKYRWRQDDHVVLISAFRHRARAGLNDLQDAGRRRRSGRSSLRMRHRQKPSSAALRNACAAVARSDVPNRQDTGAVLPPPIPRRRLRASRHVRRLGVRELRCPADETGTPRR
ncbi:MAG: type II toxin-antitoxin system RelE/ParE family toxin [Pseudomonadota bacterium]